MKCLLSPHSIKPKLGLGGGLRPRNVTMDVYDQVHIGVIRHACTGAGSARAGPRHVDFRREWTVAFTFGNGKETVHPLFVKSRKTHPERLVFVVTIGVQTFI